MKATIHKTKYTYTKDGVEKVGYDFYIITDDGFKFPICLKYKSDKLAKAVYKKLCNDVKIDE